MDPAVEYLETDEYIESQRDARSRRMNTDRSELYPDARVHYCNSVTVPRMMFELLDDHEVNPENGRCYVCDPPTKGVPDERGVLRRLRPTGATG